MVKHIILWKINEKFSNEEKENIKKNAKEALEALMGKIDGLTDIKVQISSLPSSNADMMLDSSFENDESLKKYQVNPLHTVAADTFVRPFTSERLCLDFSK